MSDAFEVSGVENCFVRKVVDPARSRAAGVDEQELLVRMSRGDQRSFDLFFDTYAARVGAFAARRASLDAAALEDVVQITMIKAMRSLNNFRRGSSLFTWLCQICRNHLVDLHRKARRQPESRSLELLEATRTSRYPVELVDYREPPDDCAVDMTRRAVRHLAKRLPASYAQVLELRYADDLSMLEIAQLLRLSESAAESRLVRARQAFREGWIRMESAASM